MNQYHHEGDTKPSWKYIKSTRSDSPGLLPLRKMVLSPLRVPTRLIYWYTEFKSAFTDEGLFSIPELPGPTHPSISSLHISPTCVAKLLSHIKINKASGPDYIPSRLLKEFGEELAPCLVDLFQSSIDCG